MTLAGRRKDLGVLAYALQRIVQLEGAWIAIDPSLELKIALGCKLGWDAMHLARIRERLKDMLVIEPVAAAPASYVRWLDAGVMAQSRSSRVHFLLAVLRDLVARAETMLASASSIADERSDVVLRSFVAEARARRLELEPWGEGGEGWLDPDRKAEGSDEPFLEFRDEQPLPPLADFPARPTHFRYDPESILNASPEVLLRTRAGVIRLLHFIYVDIEIPAMEVCARNTLEFRRMPVDFVIAMARQVWDEARHAVLVRDRMQALGGTAGEHTYDCGVWRRYHLGRTLAERLALQQVVQEANGLDATIAMNEVLRRLGDHETADMFEFINADEAVHCRMGNYWLQYCVGFDRDAYIQVLKRAAAALKTSVPGKAPTSMQIRTWAGFPSWALKAVCGAAPTRELEKQSRPGPA